MAFFKVFRKPREIRLAMIYISFKWGTSRATGSRCRRWGPGVNEIRVKDAAGIFRVLYIAKFMEAVYVLHCFQKKTQKTDPHDIELGQKRLKELLQERGI